MKKMLASFLLVFALVATAQAGEVSFKQFVPLDTIVSTGADTTSFSLWDARTADYLCPPYYVHIKFVELSDSTGLRILYDASLDTVNYGWFLFDSTITATSTATAAETRYQIDTINVPGLYMRVRVIGAATNDKASGTTVRVDALANGCGN